MASTNNIQVTIGSVEQPWPDASNTGVPVGTVLTLQSGDLTLNTPNTVVDSLDIRGSVIVRAPGCIVKRCKISQWSVFAVFIDTPAETGTPFTIQDCTILAPTGTGGTSITNSNFTALRLDVSGAENGFDITHDVTIQDCYVHDLYNAGESHSDCIQFSGNPNNVTLRHNHLISSGLDSTGTMAGGTSCIIMPPQSSGPSSNVTIDNNRVAWGAFAIYGPQGGTGTNVKITNNKFDTQFQPLCGQFGPWTDANDESDHSGNIFYPSGVPVT